MSYFVPDMAVIVVPRRVDLFGILLGDVIRINM